MFDFMHSSLDQGGARWERLQYANATKGLPREYRATNAAQLELEGRSSEDLRILATDVSKLEVISLADSHVAFKKRSVQVNFDLLAVGFHISTLVSMPTSLLLHFLGFPVRRICLSISTRSPASNVWVHFCNPGTNGLSSNLAGSTPGGRAQTYLPH